MKHLTILVCLLATVSSWAAKAVNDDALKQLCRDANNAVQAAVGDEAKQTAFETETDKWGKQYNISTIAADQVVMVFEYGGLNLDRYMRRWLEPTLSAKAEKDAAFAYLNWLYMPENDNFSHTPKETAALMQFLQSKDLQRQFDQHPDYAMGVLNALPTMKDANWETAGFPEAVLSMIKCKLPESAALECVKAFNSIARADNITKESRENIRLACLNQYNTLLNTIEVARKQKICRDNIAYLNGPFACGTLVGNTAPEMHFLRVFKQEGDNVEAKDIKTLADFKGKVILLDFWGTKCVPCIQSFPDVAKMQTYFEGKDVIILGVTSLQGYFVDIPNHRTVQCRNNPEKELGCFPDYMKGMGINWHIAVSEENVMNTDYGVLAIPHVTIIDRQGRIRYNAVNADDATKTRLIEELLNE